MPWAWQGVSRAPGGISIWSGIHASWREAWLKRGQCNLLWSMRPKPEGPLVMSKVYMVATNIFIHLLSNRCTQYSVRIYMCKPDCVWAVMTQDPLPTPECHAGGSPVQWGVYRPLPSFTRWRQVKSCGRVLLHTHSDNYSPDLVTVLD